MGKVRKNHLIFWESQAVLSEWSSYATLEREEAAWGSDERPDLSWLLTFNHGLSLTNCEMQLFHRNYGNDMPSTWLLRGLNVRIRLFSINWIIAGTWHQQMSLHPITCTINSILSTPMYSVSITGHTGYEALTDPCSAGGGVEVGADHPHSNSLSPSLCAECCLI